jgi:hypothetical protein
MRSAPRWASAGSQQGGPWGIKKCGVKPFHQKIEALARKRDVRSIAVVAVE